MASRRWWWVATAVVCLVAMAGRQEKRLEEILIDAPDRTGPEFATCISIDPTRETITCNGEEKAMAWARTQIDDGFEASGVVRIFGCEDMAAASVVLFGEPVQYIHMQLGPCFINVDAAGTVERDGVLHYVYGIEMIAEAIPAIGEIEVPADGQWHEYEWEMRFGGYVAAQCVDEPIGEKGATHAKERVVEEQWQINEEDDLHCRFDEFSRTIPPDAPYVFSPVIALQTSLSFQSFYTGEGIDELLQISVNFNQAEPDFGLLDIDIEPRVKGGSYTGNDPHLSGSGNTLTWSLPNGWPGTCFYADWSGSVTAPRFYKFANLDVQDMDGESLADLLVHCPAVEVYDATAEEWQHVVQSVAAWQAASYTDTWGGYSWDADPPPDGAVRLLPDVYFYIDKDSAREATA